MDASLSRGPDDPVISKQLSVIVANNGSEEESPVFRLPTELTMLIFQQYQSLIGAPIIVTHTCMRWRRIALNDASLWTNVHIQTRKRKHNARLDRFLSFLGMQLDRTANQPLDVRWITDIGDRFFVGTLQLIRKKAPFSRWKTLEVHITSRSQEDTPWSSVDTFTNLESLRVWYGTEDTIISAIDRTITSRLQVLDLESWPAQSLSNIMTSFANSLTHVSSLLARSLDVACNTPFPSANVVNLHLHVGEHHPFPHIETYNIRQCGFGQRIGVDLRSMTTLIVRGLLTVRYDCQVVLPALRELKLAALCVSNGGKIEAPALDILHFIYTYCPGVIIDDTLLSYTEVSLQGPGYLLSPNTSIIADWYFPTTSLITLLAKSPKVTHATLRFRNWARARAVLERLIGTKSETDSHSVDDRKMCPSLSELRLGVL